MLHVVPDDVSQGARFRDNVKRLSGTRLTFDIVMHPRQAAHALALINLAPDVTFILDHCGVPDIKGGDFDAWKRGISDLAARSNVIAKISGIVAYADSGTWTAETLRPYVEHVIDCFGWDRVVWGSDWPVCTLGGGLLAWVAATHAVLSGCSDDERDSLFWKNADRLWQLGLSARALGSPGTSLNRFARRRSLLVERSLHVVDFCSHFVVAAVVAVALYGRFAAPARRPAVLGPGRFRGQDRTRQGDRAACWRKILARPGCGS